MDDNIQSGTKKTKGKGNGQLNVGPDLDWLGGTVKCSHKVEQLIKKGEEVYGGIAKKALERGGHIHVP